MGDMFWYYLDRDWRAANAPHCDAKNLEWGYNCHLECGWGYSHDPELHGWHEERKARALKENKDTVWDMICTVCRKD
jgi:hypothetical protein